MKLNLEKTLEQLENEYWSEPNYNSYLVRTCYALRKKPIKDFEIEDLRILIGQNISLDILIPIALDRLKENIFAEGDYYKGDLLHNVLTSETQYWLENKANWQLLCKTIEANMEQMKQFETTWEIKKKWFSTYELFRRIHETNSL